MKKLAVIILFFVLLLLMAGCSDVNKPASFNTNTPKAIPHRKDAK